MNSIGKWVEDMDNLKREAKEANQAAQFHCNRAADLSVQLKQREASADIALNSAELLGDHDAVDMLLQALRAIRDGRDWPVAR